MSYTLTLSGNSSILTANYFPPIELSTNYVCALIDFQTYNSIPNIDSDNQFLEIGTAKLQIPIGSYEIDDIAKYLSDNSRDRYSIKLYANNNTLKTYIKADKPINFNVSGSVGSLLGFSKEQLTANTTHASDLPVNINKVNIIRVECNIVCGSYLNDKKVYTLHEFYPDTAPGYKILEVPRNLIYLPITKREIGLLTLTLVDQNGDLINFRGETITIRLHLKPA